MEREYKEKLKDYLFAFISENRKERFEEIIQHRTRHITVALENIFQPHNASAVLRSCDLFGIQDVHIIENSNKYNVNPQVALGSSKWLNLHKYNSAEENTLICFDALRSKGYKIVATTPHTNDCLLDEWDISQKTALIFGTELEGLSQTAIDNADAYMKIPMYGFTESFNISVSAALSLHHLSEKLRKSEVDWKLSEEEESEILIEWAKSTIKSADLYIKEFEKKYL